MNIALLKSKTDRVNVMSQQESIIKYAKSEGIRLDTTETEGSDDTIALEDRGEFKGFLQSLTPKDNVLIYDLWVFSSDTGELVKILECLLTRSIRVYICNLNLHIDESTPPLDVLTILSQSREKSLFKQEEVHKGRPKGRMSKSKFDPFRAKIIDKLTEGNSVSKISRDLGVSRTSLKDYINSRGLKELVEAKKSLLGPKRVIKSEKKQSAKKECSLIKEK